MYTFKSCLAIFLICVSVISANNMVNQENSKSIVLNSSKEKLQSIRTCIRIHTRVICSVMFHTKRELEVKLSKITTDNIDVKNIKTQNFNDFKQTHLQNSNQLKSIQHKNNQQKSIQQKRNFNPEMQKNVQKEAINKKNLRTFINHFSTKSRLKSTMSFFSKKEKSQISRNTNGLPTSTPFLKEKSILLHRISKERKKATSNNSVRNLCDNFMYLLALSLIFFMNRLI